MNCWLDPRPQEHIWDLHAHLTMVGLTTTLFGILIGVLLAGMVTDRSRDLHVAVMVFALFSVLELVGAIPAYLGFVYPLPITPADVIVCLVLAHIATESFSAHIQCNRLVGGLFLPLRHPFRIFTLRFRSRAQDWLLAQSGYTDWPGIVGVYRIFLKEVSDHLVMRIPFMRTATVEGVCM